MAASSDSFALSKSSCCGSVTSTTLSNSGLHSSSSGRLTTGTGYFNGFTSGHPGRLGKISLHKGLLLEYTQFSVQATWGETVRIHLRLIFRRCGGYTFARRIIAQPWARALRSDQPWLCSVEQTKEEDVSHSCDGRRRPCWC